MTLYNITDEGHWKMCLFCFCKRWCLRFYGISIEGSDMLIIESKIYNFQGSMDLPAVLTHNGVLYLSLGFRQEYCLQVLASRRGEAGELQLVLYDGLAYIGALLPPQGQNRAQRPENAARLLDDRPDAREPASEHLPGAQEYDVVRVLPLAAGQNQPVLIDWLQVVHTGLNCLLGREVITLEEFMRRRNFARRSIKLEPEQEERVEPGRKVLKGEEKNQVPSNTTQATQANRSKSFIIDSDSQPGRERARNEAPTQKRAVEMQQSIIIDEQELLGNQQPRQQQQKQEAEVQRFLSLPQKSMSEEDFLSINKKAIEIDLQSQPQTAPKNTQERASMYIRDLYERMHRFRIICRVNHLFHFTSHRGTACLKLSLVDETGDEIVCMLYENPQKKANKVFVKGRCYVFENGEVKSDEDGLSLTVQWSGVTELQRFIPSFVPGKMCRLGQIAKQSSFFEKAINLESESPQSRKPKEFNICGIFKGFKEEPKLAKTLFRVVGLLCDPDHDLLIQFSLLVDELASFPEQGSAVSLHNVVSVEDDRTLRLQSTKRSYILNEAGNQHEYFADLLKCSATKSWKLHEYRNLSEVTYIPRTIKELKVMLSRMMEDDIAYSEIDCSIASITERKFYNSCSVCRREARENSGMFTYCLSCKKNVKTMKRAQFDLDVQDASGSLTACLFSDEMQGFVNLPPEEYTNLSKLGRDNFNELCAYAQIVMKVKSCRLIGGTDHKAVSATRFNHKRGLSAIKSLVIEEKTKYTAW